MAASGDYLLVPADETYDFVKRCMVATGVKESHAEDLASLLHAADTRGHFSHGLNRLGMYVNDVLDTSTAKVGEPTVLKETVATAHVDANNVLGPTAGKFCIDLAIEKAKVAGIGWVTCKGSNHYGIAGWYSMRAASQGLIGMSFTNTSPLMVPTRGKEPVLGTNPISVSAPAKDGDMYVLDMATTTAAVGKVEMKVRKEEELPRSWAVDKDGMELHEGKKVLTGNGGLQPLGGLEESAGYKGYGLGMMVEVFCGILGGSAYGHHIRHWLGLKKPGVPSNLGQGFVALDPKCFADGFEDRMSDLMDHCRNLEPVEGQSEVLAPGDPERKHIKKVESEGGIYYHEHVVNEMNQIAKRLNVAPLKIIS